MPQRRHRSGRFDAHHRGGRHQRTVRVDHRLHRPGLGGDQDLGDESGHDPARDRVVDPVEVDHRVPPATPVVPAHPLAPPQPERIDQARRDQSGRAAGIVAHRGPQPVVLVAESRGDGGDIAHASLGAEGSLVEWRHAGGVRQKPAPAVSPRFGQHGRLRVRGHHPAHGPRRVALPDHDRHRVDRGVEALLAVDPECGERRLRTEPGPDRTGITGGEDGGRLHQPDHTARRDFVDRGEQKGGRVVDVPADVRPPAPQRPPAGLVADRVAPEL